MHSRKHIVLVAALTLAVAFVTSPLAPLVLAQETAAPVVAETAATATPTQPEEVATVVVNQDVVIPYGQYVEDLGQLAEAWLIPALLAGLTWVTTRYVPLPLRGIANSILTRQAEQLLQKALEFGINSTAGAERNATLKVDVANSVLRKAANYAIANGWPKLIDFLDGPDGILQKLFARLDIPVEVTAEQMNVPPPKVSPAKAKVLNTAAKKAGTVVPNWVMLK